MDKQVTVEVRMAKVLGRLIGQPGSASLKLAAGSSLGDLLAEMERRWPGLAGQVRGEGGQVVDHVNIYVNGDNVRYSAGIATVLGQGDMVNIIPAAAAG